jgi:hypothetical protein
MTREFSDKHFRIWSEGQTWESGRFGIMNAICQRMIIDKIPSMVEAFIRFHGDVEIGNFVYMIDERNTIVRIGPSIKEPAQDPDKFIMLTRQKADGTKIEIAKRDFKIANNEAEILKKPAWTIFGVG